MEKNYENEKSKKEIHIPLPVPEEKEYTTGIAEREKNMIILNIVLDIILCIIVQSIFHIIFITLPVGIIFLGLGITMFIRKDIYNENGLDRIKVKRNFKNAQKNYEYERFDWTRRETGEKE